MSSPVPIAAGQKSRFTVIAEALKAAAFSQDEVAAALLTGHQNSYATSDYGASGVWLNDEGVAEVQRIHAMCAYAKRPEAFIDFYRRGLRVKEVSAELLAAIADASDALVTDNHPPMEQNTVVSLAAAIWKRRRGQA
jgi:hypothetical protein